MESNIKIALSPFSSKETKENIEHYIDSGNGFGLGNFYNMLSYDKGWESLMNVWVEILKWGVSEHGVQWEQQIKEDAVLISNNRNGNLRIIKLALHGTLTIERVYSAVVDFITWHNSQK